MEMSVGELKDKLSKYDDDYSVRVVVDGCFSPLGDMVWDTNDEQGVLWIREKNLTESLNKTNKPQMCGNCGSRGECLVYKERWKSRCCTDWVEEIK